ncbi:MAG: class I SAM-dependent methyltransferase [Caldilineaceae bacterium]|nr:class I SAM-dependent methyltransferase [Caldilineaceae bacterium]
MQPDLTPQDVSMGAGPAQEGDSAAVFDRFARYYDDDYRHYADDVDALLALAEETGGPVLELGCGTGRLLLPLAQAGHTLTGVDISPALLAVARRKLAQANLLDRVTLVEGDLRRFALPRRDFGFAFFTSNTLMHLSTPGAQLAALAQAARHLRRGGLLLVDLFHPDIARLIEVHGLMELADQWETADGAQVVKWSVRTLDLAAQFQETLFIYEETAPDGSTRRTLCPFTLRYLWRNEAELMLAAAGLAVEAVWGDFDGGPYDSQSEHLILVASKANAG